MSLHSGYVRAIERSRSLLDAGADLLNLAIRVHIAHVFFTSGLTKVRNWDGTRTLFSDDYRVPLIPTDVAAVLATAGELALPVLLAFGLFARFGAAGLFVVNAVALYAYWHVLSELEPALYQHYVWGAALLVPLLDGPGRLSLDAWFVRRGASSAMRAVSA